MLGFAYREELHGGYYLLADPVLERAADLLLDIEVRDVLSVAQSRTATLTGTISFAGFADQVLASGELVLHPDGKRATYALSFKSNAGERYRFRGHKELSVLNVVDSVTLVRGSLYDDSAREMGRSVVRFDARGNWKSLVKSFRLAW